MSRVRAGDSRSRLGWLALLAVAVGWSLWGAGVGRRAVANPRGWPLVTKFLRAFVHPDLSGEFLRATGRATLVTVAYATLGTALSVVIGAIGGLLLAESTWLDQLSGAGWASRGSRWLVRVAMTLPRGIHEAVWCLFLLNVLGRDPMVAVLAIAIPYSAITAKVYSELIDESAGTTYRSLRAGGARRFQAILYGVLPATADDLLSYGFYRFECGIRAAVILGMIGVGGLGFQLSQSFQGLQYGQMWTVLFVLIAIGTLGEAWSARLRNRRTVRVARASLLGGMALLVASWWYVGLRPWHVWAPKARHLLRDITSRSWPPRLPRHGWPELWSAWRDTLQMSVLSIVAAFALAMVVTILGARGSLGNSWWARGLGAVARAAALIARTIPPTVWALLVLFVVFPGPLPGAIALGLYTFGVLARLLGEVLENQDPRGRRALRDAGAGPFAAFAYGSLPDAAPRWVAYSLYRWEVTARETVVVGVVGAGGLGRLLSKQTTAFDYRAMVSTLAAMIALTLLVDVISAAARRALR